MKHLLQFSDCILLFFYMYYILKSAFEELKGKLSLTKLFQTVSYCFLHALYIKISLQEN